MSNKFANLKRKVEKVFIHCSASNNPDHDNIETIRRWHVDERGWQDVGYHFFIRRSGEINDGRSLEVVPAAQRGHNSGSIAICLHGLVGEDFTASQFRTLQRTCQSIRDGIDNVVTFHGHCEVNPGKKCPAFDYKYVLGLGELGHLPVRDKVLLSMDVYDI